MFTLTYLRTPLWYYDLEGRGERFQQLGLMHAMSKDLTTATFGTDLALLMDVEGPSFLSRDDPDPVDSRMCDEWQLFIHIVMNSGRRSLEVMRAADFARLGQQYIPETLVGWLWDTWAIVEQRLSKDFENKQVGTTLRLTHTSDQWLERHIPSMHRDLQVTSEINIVYELRGPAFVTHSELRAPLLKAIIS
jgi:hypothetical protein